jgi:drug/metabolite transporter (DMT)-like permease
MTNTLWLLVFSAMLAVGQMLFKVVARNMQGVSLGDGLLVIAGMPMLYMALALYGAATLLWIWILSRVPLSQAYPWVAVAMAAVPVLASFVFGERVGSSYWLGISLVIAGVGVTQYASVP